MSSPSQLFSCVNATAILRHPLNKSKSKTHWSLSKDDRFKIRKSYCDSFYQIPTTKVKRHTSFGFGKKTDLQIDKHPHQITPCPTTYNIPTFVQTNKQKNKGFTPRFSRQQIKPMSYIQLEPYKMPGPGRYQQFRYNDTPHWSLHPRTSQDLFPKTTQKIVPGPGTHELVDNIHPIGKYNQSKRKNSKAKVFNPPHSKRFSKSSTDAPGPGNYNPKNDIQGNGEYVLSINTSHGHRKFLLGTNRDSFVDEDSKRTKTPGPGTYRAPSDFGQYDEIVSSRSQKILTLVKQNTKDTKA